MLTDEYYKKILQLKIKGVIKNPKGHKTFKQLNITLGRTRLKRYGQNAKIGNQRCNVQVEHLIIIDT